MRAIAKFIHPEVFQEVQRLKEITTVQGEELATLHSEISRLMTELAQLAQDHEEALAQIEATTTKYNELVATYDDTVDKLNFMRAQNESLEDAYDALEDSSAEEVREWYDRLQTESATPWAIFEIQGFDENGMKVGFNWNPTFIETVTGFGFTGESDAEIVENFFTMMKALPSSVIGD